MRTPQASMNPVSKGISGGRACVNFAGMRVLYIRHGFDVRRITFLPSGAIDGAGSRERFWAVRDENGQPSLGFFADDLSLTAMLRPTGPGLWSGTWRAHERMAVEIRFPTSSCNDSERDFSQYGEQHLILEFFAAKQDGYFLDIGASDGIIDSNTRALHLRGWRGTLVEPVSEEFWRLAENYAGTTGVQLVNAAIADLEGYGKIWVARQPHADGRRYDNRHTLSKVMAEKASADRHPAVYDVRDVRLISVEKLVSLLPEPPDFVSVDAEGMDDWILLRLLELSVRPRLVVFENDKGNGDVLLLALQALGYSKMYQTSANVAYARSP